MSRKKDTGYLFAKMSSTKENEIGHVMVGEQKEVKSPIPPTRTYNFGEKSDEKRTLKKWILNNIMLLVTLTGVLAGVIAGK